MKEQAIAPAEAIRLGSLGVGVSHPTDSIDDKHVTIAAGRQGKTETPDAIAVRASQGVSVRVPPVEGPHNTDPPGGGRLEPEYGSDGTLRSSVLKGGTADEERDGEEDARDEAPAANDDAVR